MVQWQGATKRQKQGGMIAVKKICFQCQTKQYVNGTHIPCQQQASMSREGLRRKNTDSHIMRWLTDEMRFESLITYNQLFQYPEIVVSLN